MRLSGLRRGRESLRNAAAKGRRRRSDLTSPRLRAREGDGKLFHVKLKTYASQGKDCQRHRMENPNHEEGKSKPREAKSKLLPSTNPDFSRACGRIQIESHIPLGR